MMNVQLLLHERSEARLGPWLAERTPPVAPVVVTDAGELRVGGRAVAVSDLELTLAWANHDVFSSPARRPFMIACLKSSTLRVFFSSAAGYDHPVFGWLVDKGITLCSGSAAAPGIAEFVLARVLEHFRALELRRAHQAERAWRSVWSRELGGSHWLVIGLGSIGSAVARLARAFGATVVGARRRPRGDEPVERVVPLEALPTEVGAADVVVLCAPSNRESHHLVSDALLEKLKPGSVLVNVGRGALIDEAALLRALERGAPELAVLDVFAAEPLPAESPLWAHPRVRVSAHDSALSDAFVARGDESFRGNMDRYLAGEPLEGVVSAEEVKASLPGSS